MLSPNSVGYNYKRYDLGLDLVLLNYDFESDGKIHYVQAKCNKCKKKVKLLRSDWMYGNIKKCPGCTGENKRKKSQQSEDSTVKTNQPTKKSEAVKIKAKAVVQEEAKVTVPRNILIDSVICGSRVIKNNGVTVFLRCEQCGNVVEISKTKLQGYDNTKRICDCLEPEKVDIGLIQKVTPDKQRKSISDMKQIPGWIFIKTIMVGKKDGMHYLYRCATCGKKEEFRSYDAVHKFNGICKRCEKIKDSKEIPLTKMDWMGYTTRCRRVIKTYIGENNIKMADVQCLICNDIESIALASVIYGDLDVCNKCESKLLQLLCPVCKKVHLKNNLKGLYSEIKSDIICVNENKKIPKDELVEEHEFKVRMQYIKSKYNGKYKFLRKTDGDNEKAGLIIFDSGYKGTDGIEYRNCMCPKHNKFLCISDEEIEGYRHDFCMNLRMIPANTSRALK